MATNVSSVSSHFPSAQDSFTTTLASDISSAAATVPLTSVSGYNNGEVAVFIIDPSTPTKKQTFTGIVDTAGVQITSVVWTAGSNQAHTAGATVVDYASATHVSMMSKGFKVAHNQDGTHKSGATYASPVFSGSASGTYTLGGTVTVTTPTIASFANATHDHSNSAGGGSIGALAVTTGMLAAAAVTVAKMGLVITASTNGNTAGGSTNYLNLGSFKIQWGTTAQTSSINAAASLERDVTFGTAFSGTPDVIVGPVEPSAAPQFFTYPKNRSTTAFTIAWTNAGSGASTCAAMWIALGN